MFVPPSTSPCLRCLVQTTWQRFVSDPLSPPPSSNSTGGNYDSRFDVGKASGTLIVARPLDAEQKSNYNLTVEATDGTRTVSTQVNETPLKGSASMTMGGGLHPPVCWDVLMW